MIQLKSILFLNMFIRNINAIDTNNVCIIFYIYMLIVQNCLASILESDD